MKHLSSQTLRWNCFNRWYNYKPSWKVFYQWAIREDGKYNRSYEGKITRAILLQGKLEDSHYLIYDLLSKDDFWSQLIKSVSNLDSNSCHIGSPTCVKNDCTSTILLVLHLLWIPMDDIQCLAIPLMRFLVKSWSYIILH